MIKKWMPQYQGKPMPHKSYFGFTIGGGCKAGYCKKRGIKK